MLVLTRMKSECLIFRIGGVIVGRVMLVESRNGKCRLGLEFHDSVEIVREELLKVPEVPKLQSPFAEQSPVFELA